MLINVALYCIDFAFGDALRTHLALWPLDNPLFRPWQVVTYAFMHQSTTHLLVNMFGLWMFGSELERLWGVKRYLQFLLASVLAAAMVQLALAVILDWNAGSVGASGGLFGLLLAFAMTFPNLVITPLLPPIPMKAKYYVAIYGAVELVLGIYDPRSGVGHFGHLGGMLGGWLMLRYWAGKPPFSGRPQGPRRRF